MMKTFELNTKRTLLLVVAAILMAGPAMAEKSDFKKGGKNLKTEQRAEKEKSRRDQDDSYNGRHFEERHKVIVQNYYVTQYRGGRCPPGLAKKNNGCMPPGQAKKWNVGQPLPSHVIYYEVPQALVIRIGPPPSGYRYVRVASDILMIAIGTGMIVDALQNLDW